MIQFETPHASLIGPDREHFRTTESIEPGIVNLKHLLVHSDWRTASRFNFFMGALSLAARRGVWVTSDIITYSSSARSNVCVFR
jgi:hypothetical protein